MVLAVLGISCFLHAQNNQYSRSELCNESDRFLTLSDINVCNVGEWVLVFEDNFDNGHFSPIWQNSTDYQGKLYGNNGKAQEYNTLDNVFVSDGSMKIVANQDSIYRRASHWRDDNVILKDGLPNFRLYQYTSAYVETKTVFSFGMLEAMVKIPKGKGFWPAFWMYDIYKDSQDTIYNEIDVFEFWNETNSLGNYDSTLLSKVHVMTSHYRDVEDQCSFDYEGCDFSEAFHKFSVRWEPNVIEWYVDDVLKRRDIRYHTLLGQEVGCVLYSNTYYQEARVFPHYPMHVIFNLAIQHSIDTTWSFNDPSLPITGIIDNCPDEDTHFPSQMEIRWVRYYQRFPYQNVRIENSSQYQLTSGLYNVIAGKSVSIDCDFLIQNEEYLTIIADERTSIGPGFNAKLGSNVRISPCNWSLNKSIFQPGEEVQKNEQIKKQQLNIDLHSYSSQGVDSICNTNDIGEYNSHIISVYPNPSHGSFYIEIDNVGDEQYDLTVKNIMGTTVITKSITTTRTRIVHNTPGVYYVCLRGNRTGLITVKKLIII